MTQNISSAVMQQRSEPHDSLDDFPTPPWATRALLDHLINGLWWPYVDGQSVREPAANRGHMVKPLAEYFGRVEASDIHDYGAGFPVQDYLFGPLPPRTDWTITNPPFRLAEQFIQRGLECSDAVGVIVRSAFLEGVGRHRDLFSVHRPALVLQFTERVVMHKGKLSAKGSTATAYCWIIWRNSHTGPTDFDWIPPCRKRLERAEDYL
jgi:hypothetical protein